MSFKISICTMVVICFIRYQVSAVLHNSVCSSSADTFTNLPLPGELNQFSSMRSLVLGEWKLKGTIPSEIGELGQLVSQCYRESWLMLLLQYISEVMNSLYNRVSFS